MKLKRTKNTLLNMSRNIKIVRSVDDVIAILQELIDVVGDESVSRQNFYRLGEVLLTVARPQVMVPICPDYSHKDGKYDFISLGSSVPLLAQLHVDFLRSLPNFDFNVVFLIADQEAFDERLRRKVSLSQSEFTNRVLSSKQKVVEWVAEFGWSCFTMTEYFPELISSEERIELELVSTELGHLRIDTSSRMSMYRSIGSIGFDEGVLRTVKTAAQYIALARCVKAMGSIVANHTTVNLRRYKNEGVALLHNPVAVY